ncbi:hypothetical protein N7453_003107 [Penicillium expansum]|nr:hypothetical protein N7453_003107 [Penicillium expansum]
MSGPKSQHYQIDDFTFEDGTGPTSIQLAFLDINPTADKVALVLTCFRGRLQSTLNFSHGTLKEHRVIVVALFGNGESSSPSNMANFPPIGELPRLRSCSAPVNSLASQNPSYRCGARTSRHNYQFLEGPKAALQYSADYRKGDSTRPSSKPLGGLRAFGKAYSAWLTSPEWFEKEMYQSLGYKTLSDWDKDTAGTNYHNWHPDDLLAMVGMWQRGDITLISGDVSLQETLSRIKARVLVMPCSTDQYFRWEASETEARVIPHSTFKVIPSVWGHLAGLGCNPADKDFMDEAITWFLKEQ